MDEIQKQRLIANNSKIAELETECIATAYAIADLKLERDSMINLVVNEYEAKYKENKVTYSQYSNATSRELYAKKSESVAKLLLKIKSMQKAMEEQQVVIRRLLRDHDIDMVVLR